MKDILTVAVRSAVFIGIVIFASSASAFRCNDLLVTEGTPTYKVLANCLVIDQSVERLFVEQDGAIYNLRVINGKVNSIDMDIK